MNTKTLSPRALSVIDQYLHFKVGAAVCSVPYMNNKTLKARGALPAYMGKGSPKEIAEEASGFLLKNHIRIDSLADESLKKLLVDRGLGIDCSALAYYILNAESEETTKGSLDKHLHFVQSHGLVGKFMSRIRPANNTGVLTLADEKNSAPVPTGKAQPGDMVIMLGDPDDKERNHILVIHQVDYQNFMPTKLFYSHAVAYPEDGEYGTGIKQGSIEIMDPAKGLLDQKWSENGKEGSANNIFVRAQKSKTELRRLKWL